MSFQAALRLAEIKANETLRPQSIVQVGDAFQVLPGFDPSAHEHVFPSDAAAFGGACRAGNCG